MIKARASGSKVYLYFMKKGRQARHRIPRNSFGSFYLQNLVPGPQRFRGKSPSSDACMISPKYIYLSVDSYFDPFLVLKARIINVLAVFSTSLKQQIPES